MLKDLNVNELRTYLETAIKQDAPVNGYRLDGFSLGADNYDGKFPVILEPISFDDMRVLYNHVQAGGTLFEHYGKV